MNAKTDDIDENGKPEFWIGGRDFGEGISKFFCYESDGDNSYVPVASIELRYLVSLYTAYLQAVDIDNDGKQELIINVGNCLLILKFTGKSNQHSYKLWYAKINELTQPGSSILPSTIYDFNKDGKKDILLSLDIYPPPAISYILVQDSVTSVLDENLQILNQFDIQQNYPNPFNSSTSIKFALPLTSDVRIEIFNMLGESMGILSDGIKEAGYHTLSWNAPNVASGIYFYSIQSKSLEGNKDFNSVKKMLLVK